jgi:hypothetical protein
MSALGQNRPFKPSQPNVRFAPIAVIQAMHMSWGEHSLRTMG